MWLRLPLLLATLAGSAALAACGGTAPPPETVAAPAGAEGFAETGGSRPAATSTEPPIVEVPEAKPPPVLLRSKAGIQQAVQGSYCVTLVTATGQGTGVYADTPPVHPAELTVAAPAETLTIQLADASLRVPEGSADLSSIVTVHPLGCGPDRTIAELELRSATAQWMVDLPSGAYEVAVFAYFETRDGRSGDTYAVLGLLVDPEGEGEVIPVDESLAVCPYSERP